MHSLLSNISSLGRRDKMINNPQIGMRIRVVNSDGALWGHLENRVGTIISIGRSILNRSVMSIIVELDVAGNLTGSQWSFYSHHLEPYILSAEDQERKKREDYANQYL